MLTVLAFILAAAAQTATPAAAPPVPGGFISPAEIAQILETGS